MDISAYTTRSSGHVAFDGRIQFVKEMWQLSPRGYGAQRFFLPDSELVSVDPAPSDSLSKLWPWALGGLLLAGIVVGIVYIGLGGSDP